MTQVSTGAHARECPRSQRPSPEVGGPALRVPASEQQQRSPFLLEGSVQSKGSARTSLVQSKQTASSAGTRFSSGYGTPRGTVNSCEGQVICKGITGLEPVGERGSQASSVLRDEWKPPSEGCWDASCFP